MCSVGFEEVAPEEVEAPDTMVTLSATGVSGDTAVNWSESDNSCPEEVPGGEVARKYGG